jgi:chitinase
MTLFATMPACSANTDGAASSGNQDLSQAQCASAAPWASGVAYAVGAVVTYNGSVYVCIQAHTSEPGWTPDAVPALWALAQCTGGSGSGGSGSGSGSSSGGCAGSSSGGSSGGSGGSSGGSGSSSGSSSGGSSGSSSGGSGGPSASFVFSPYKDTSINMNWNTNVISTSVSGSATPLASDITAAGGKAITLAFATGECGSENWGGVAGDALASANVSLLTGAGVKYVISTGGAAGSFTCGSDSGFSTFVGRWMSANLVGVDFDIEAGQSQQVIQDLVSRIKTAHATWPSLRFSLTLATLANNAGASTAQSLGSGAQDSFNTYGDETLAAVKSVLGFNGSASTWPSYLTVDLMTMDYGSASAGVCVVSGGSCQMGQSAIQAAYNLHDVWGVPYSAIELTPMLGGNDVSSEQFTLSDADTISSFAKSQGLAGIHYWSYDRDVDCAQGSASATCNSMGSGYAGPHGYLKRFLSNGL